MPGLEPQLSGRVAHCRRVTGKHVSCRSTEGAIPAGFFGWASLLVDLVVTLSFVPTQAALGYFTDHGEPFGQICKCAARQPDSQSLFSVSSLPGHP